MFALLIIYFYYYNFLSHIMKELKECVWTTYRDAKKALAVSAKVLENHNQVVRGFKMQSYFCNGREYFQYKFCYRILIILSLYFHCSFFKNIVNSLCITADQFFHKVTCLFSFIPQPTKIVPCLRMISS